MSELSNPLPARRAWPASASAWLGALALLAGALVALVLLWRAGAQLLALISYPYPHDGLEGTLLYEARLLWSGEPLYQPMELYRFVAAPYPPVHPLLLGLFDRIAGPHIFWGGRLLSLLSAVGVGALLVLQIRRISGSWLAGLLSAALFLSAPPTLLWATRIKPDMLALLWTMLGLFLATDGLIRRERGAASYPALIGAAICFALAFFTKQTALAAPLAAGLALLLVDIQAYIRGERAAMLGRLPIRRSTLGYAISYLALIGAVWLLLDLLTNGQFSFHIWVMHRNAMWSQALMWKFVSLLAPYWPAMLLAVVLLVHSIRQPEPLVAALYALAAPLTLLGAGKTGANHNHLLETLLALCIALGAVAAWAAGARPHRIARQHTDAAAAPPAGSRGWPAGLRYGGLLLGIALCGMQLALAFRPQEWYIGELAPDDPPERFLTFIKGTPGEMLSDDVGLLFMAGKPLRYDDPTGFGPVALSGLWDQRGLVEDIQNKRFSAILLPLDIKDGTTDPAGHWTPEMIAAIRQYYRLAFHDRINTYVPR